MTESSDYLQMVLSNLRNHIKRLHRFVYQFPVSKTLRKSVIIVYTLQLWQSFDPFLIQSRLPNPLAKLHFTPRMNFGLRVEIKPVYCLAYAVIGNVLYRYLTDVSSCSPSLLL